MTQATFVSPEAERHGAYESRQANDNRLGSEELRARFEPSPLRQYLHSKPHLPTFAADIRPYKTRATKLDAAGSTRNAFSHTRLMVTLDLIAGGSGK